jgi:hypothetical protein
MSSIAGWAGAVPEGGNVLERMAEVMSGPRPKIARCITGDFAATTTQPTVGAVERIASSDDGQVTLVFAGYLLTEDSDARCFPARHCLALYLDSGLSFPEGLNGSFAIVIHDGRQSELHLITDRVMSRPLYHHAGDPFLFASEVKAVLEFPGVSRTVNMDRMVEFLVVQRAYGSDTYYDHIKRVPGASVTTWDGTGLRSTRYWEAPFDAEKCWDLNENAERTYRATQNATRRACAGSESPVLMLSGGLDSRLVASACDTHPLCVTMHNRLGFEVRTARRVASALGCDHQFLQLPPDFPLARVTDGSLLSDGMAGFYHAHFLYMSDTLVAQETDLLLTGVYLEVMLSDTLLPTRPLRVLGRRCRAPRLMAEENVDVPEHVWRRRAMHEVPAVRSALKGDRIDQVVGQLQERIAEEMPSPANGSPDVYDVVTFTCLSHACLNRSNPNVLSMERLAPAPVLTCDTELIDLFFTIPAQHRLYHRLYASLFTTVDRRCRWIPYANHGMPVFNSALLEYLAASVSRTFIRGLSAGLRRVSKAHGERLDRRAWPRIATAMRDCPEWHKYLRGRVESSRLADMGVVRGDILRSMVEHQIAGTDNKWAFLGNWITLEEWLAHYG